MASQEDKNAFWQLEDRLMRAASAPELLAWTRNKSSEASTWQAAYELTVAMGRCQLCGYLPANPELLAPLYLSMVDAAAQGALLAIEKLGQEIDHLEDDIFDAVSRFEVDEFTIGILEGRLDLEAARLAMQESIRVAEAASIQFPQYLRPRLLVLDHAVERLDERIWEERDLLCRADETYWVENVRACLGPMAWPDRPWWLRSDIAEIRASNQRQLEIFAARGDQLLMELRDSPVATPRSVQGEVEQRLPDEQWALAADASAEAAGHDLMRFSLELGDKRALEGESAVVEFLLPGKFAEATLAAIAPNTLVRILVQIQTTRDRLRLDDQGVERRQYVLRWGLFHGVVEVEQHEPHAQTPILLLGSLSVPWRIVRPLHDAPPSNRRIYLRRRA